MAVYPPCRGVEVKQLNRQVKRNIERFPSDFMFQLAREECLRCQIGTINDVGASLNFLGKRCFAFSSLDKSNIPDILAKI